MCFRPPTVESRKVCPECGFENVGEGVGTLKNCEKCGAELPMSEMELLGAQINGSAPGVPGAPGAPGMPPVPKAPGSAPNVPPMPPRS